MNTINLKNLKKDDVVTRFSDFVQKYSFGSGTKKDVDIELFLMLCDLGVVSPTLLDVQCKLNVSRSQAKSMIEERERRILNEKLSKKSIDDILKEELQDILSKGLYEFENGKLKLEVSSPLLQDYIKEKLREQRIIADSSFNSDFVVVSIKSYIVLCDQLFSANVKAMEEEIQNHKIEKKLDEILKVLIEIKNDKKDIEKSCKASDFLKQFLERIAGVSLTRIDWSSLFETISSWF